MPVNIIDSNSKKNPIINLITRLNDLLIANNYSNEMHEYNFQLKIIKVSLINNIALRINATDETVKKLRNL